MIERSVLPIVSTARRNASATANTAAAAAEIDAVAAAEEDGQRQQQQWQGLTLVQFSAQPEPFLT